MHKIARVIVNNKLLYKTVIIVCFAHKDDIIAGFVSWNDNVFVVKVSLVSNSSTCIFP